LGNAELRQSTDDNAVYFDVLSLATFWWPQRWTMSIAVAALALLLVSGAVRLRGGAFTVGGVTVGIASFFLSLAFAFVTALVAGLLIGLRSTAAIWTAQPGPTIAAGWLIGIACTIAVACVLIRRAGFEGLFIGHAICWCAVAIALARMFPGVSYIAVVPAAALAITAALCAVAGGDTAIGSIVCAAIAALLQFNLALLFYDAFGRPSIIVIAVVLALVTTTFSPLVAEAASIRGAATAALFATAAVCVVMQWLIPPFTAKSPRHINIHYVDDGSRVEWEADDLTRPLRDAGFARTTVRLPWLARASIVAAAPAARLPLVPPDATIVARAPGHVRIRIRSPRGAQRIALTFHTTQSPSITINGIVPPAEAHRQRSAFIAGWRRVVVRGASEATIDLYFRLNVAPIDAVVSDYSFGLPPSAAAIGAARDRSPAVPVQDGDGIVMMRSVSLK
ncbi:MAG TPA: hypothetical protein VLU46_16800, partial [Thermoanaerobaculia bacterium]|nr:hypothetical protein [Thermoanaerobaculia bacterium]